MFVALHFVIHLKAKGNDPTEWEITKEKQGRKILGLTLWHWKCWFESVTVLGAWAYVPAVLLLLAALITIIPFQRGAAEAESQIANIQASGCGAPVDHKDHVGCVSLTDISVTPSASIFTGILVSSNSSHVALFDGKTLEVFPLTEKFKLSKPHVQLNPPPQP